MIIMKDVVKRYDNGITALNKVNVHIKRGEFVYLIGPSGAGKSTFIKLIYREETPTQGLVKVGNKDITRIKNKHIPLLRRDVGVVFQDFKLLPRLTVYENVAYAMKVIEKKPREIKRRVTDVLDLVGLSDKAKMFPDEISGGEIQRVSIARAIANTPNILIADEPTGNLDPETAEGIMAILEEVNAKGTTVIMATHNNDIVNQLQHRVIAIEGGRIVHDEEKGEYLYEN
ncbi:cell division ATP-binding protein FtsE [Dolosigranulum pigrum]|jgi:cell division ATP-binding protein ftsE|uniref:Cell division ATP-binding protein FtsE n=2 Tax=Dolosigranulum pigrum TaxID=29394 RepID=H3NGJ2_9LACT|nr:cell division ATP-binding protein FtsE [Dolosigranulum pigrum]EHR31756.1 cell division ATP-binding protein FtsE [Dolosigranulum pigrum ATCC 51524]OOL81418.1 cell division ATP-binding protein FtsE [Dolosigranulum pigrum]QDO92010.1 cell division ATP-binding protein FtsE [Dolosigranulum pigrum]QJS95899.1 cell division ATP-binding protein FtsE [Dolosigranulum pigrum]QJS97264.1 cell division ATP-binding protein FtsE [Dolosigranulum pigrum]